MKSIKDTYDDEDLNEIEVEIIEASKMKTKKETETWG
jgi:hypothetical protein